MLIPRHPFAIFAARSFLVCNGVMFSAAALATQPVAAPAAAVESVTEPAVGSILPRGVASTGTRLQVWVDLSMPAIAGLLMPSARAAYAQAVNAQQELVLPSLRALGAVELARLRLLNNSIAIELPADAVDAVRQLPGVIRVRPIIDRHHIGPPPPTQ